MFFVAIGLAVLSAAAAPACAQAKALRAPEFRGRFSSLGADPIGSTQQELAAWLLTANFRRKLSCPG
ncbi:MAG: hypothetical protein ACREMQ_00110 [Longimicrobiales bacterium]